MELTTKQLREYVKTYQHLSENTIKCLASDYKTERGLISKLETDNKHNAAIHAQPMPVYIEIEIEWKKSYMYGWNPEATIRWEDEAKNWHVKRGYKVSGYGYDKHSSVIASALNDNFKNWLFSIRNKSLKNKPYGISFYKGSFPSFEGGVGMSCYPRIFKWLNWACFHVAEGEHYDKWIFCEKKRAKDLKFREY